MNPMEGDPPGGGRTLAPPAPSQSNPASGEINDTSAPGPSPLPPAELAPGISASGTPGSSKRKRGLGVVTPNACTECRKKRAKCDGKKPCGRCNAQKDVECKYEIPVRQSKENLRHEIDRLRRQQRNNESVIGALARPDMWEEVLSRLRSGQSVEAISEWLEGGPHSGGESLRSVSRPLNHGSDIGASISGYAIAAPGSHAPILPSLGAGSPASVHQHPNARHDAQQQSHWASHFPTAPASSTHPKIPDDWNPEAITHAQSRVGLWVEGQIQALDGWKSRGSEQVLLPNVPEMQVPARTWTTITADAGLVQHLLALYFCWEYPTFASLSKEHFLKDFMEGRPRFCSSILVNALLALGCRFSNQPHTRSDPDDPHTSGNHFFQECQRLFEQEQNHHSLTTIQALGIMSIREASCGRDSESWFYAGQSIRLAVEMGLHRLQDDGLEDDESAVQAATFWGAFALDHAWSLATGTLPQCSCFPQLPPKPAIIDDIEASLWIPYTDDGAPLQRACQQPSNVRSVYKCFCELSELVHQSLYILYSPGRPLTSRDLLIIYTQYLNWYDKIPEVLRLGHNFTPAVLFAHMYYQFAILLLFRPLIKLRIIGSSISPRDVCLQAADAITGLLRSYAQLYTLRRTPSFVPYFVLTSSIMHLAIAATHTTSVESSKAASQDSGSPHPAPKLDPHATEAFARGIADLTEMAPCHHFAEQALNILRFLAKKWNIDVEIRTTGGNEPHRLELPDFERATRPVTVSLNLFAPNFLESDFNCTWGAGTSGGIPAEVMQGGRPNTSARETDALENPLFWPFPMQGRPILSNGKELKEAGFELL
ncbi:fungal-specific transcription factor domain-containing protein [Chaetomium strumarium]|uniref:Fungal-specific transcription factor domain-containing protein n=1 Tax=Chaetomium strumarium TaxID=1170767 RepID=A0AAJ0H391_9PEZI|nr:fungal-specific transcription factor domain-containing protein [Chaetomium strumarium]